MTQEETAGPTNRFPKKYAIVGLGLIALAGAFVLRSVIIERSDLSNDDSSAIPREVANAPYIESKQPVVDLMVKVAQPKKDQLVYDLGCGDGRIVIGCAKASGCRGIGIEYEKDIAETARQNIKDNGLEEQIEVIHGDVFKEDFTDADCIVMYILPDMVKKLYPEFKKLKPGVRIVSHNYGFGGDLDDLPPDERHEVNVPGDGTHRVYLWVTPLGELKD